MFIDIVIFFSHTLSLYNVRIVQANTIYINGLTLPGVSLSPYSVRAQIFTMFSSQVQWLIGEKNERIKKKYLSPFITTNDDDDDDDDDDETKGANYFFLWQKYSFFLRTVSVRVINFDTIFFIYSRQLLVCLYSKIFDWSWESEEKEAEMMDIRS